VSISLIAILILVALALAMSAAALVVKDLLHARPDGALATSESGKEPLRLRRLPKAPDDRTVNGPLDRFDRWFLRLIRETGLPLTPTNAVLLLVLCGALAGGALFVWNEHPLPAIIGVSLGMAGALTYLVVQRARRVQQLQGQLPSALEMLARGMRAGQSLDQAVALVGERSPEPLATEFRLCAKQLAMGLSLAAVMRSLVDRVRLFDVRIFTTTLTVHRQTGGNVAKVLERLASVVRERLNFRRQLRATTGAGRLSAILVGSIGPILFAYLFFCHPEYMQSMLDSPLGQSLLLGAVLLEIAGLAWTIRLLKPAY
jgi:tight adherence protein B